MAGAASYDWPLDWLTARPLAHRGLHDETHGLIENTAGAVRAAIAANYGIEVDVQVSADGEAMVHHDAELGRLTDGAGRLDRLTAAELKRVKFRQTADAMMTLGDLCDLVAGRIAMAIELKSNFDGDTRLALRAVEVLAAYCGPAAPMSFDPVPMTAIRAAAPRLPRGVIAAKYRPHPYWDLMPMWARHGMGFLLTAVPVRPHFIAYNVADLSSAVAPQVARQALGLPLLTWTVRTEAERAVAAQWADQIIFEGLRP
jgi:glycerophosphoryl diester phosphodiesterase